MEDSSDTFQKSLKNESLDPRNLTLQKIEALLKDRTQAEACITNCKYLIKNQNNKLKKQKQDFDKTIATLETQSFTTKFHAVAFRLEMDVMKLIGIRRKFDAIDLKSAFYQFSKAAAQKKSSEEDQIKCSLNTLKGALETVWHFFKLKKLKHLQKGMDALRVQNVNLELGKRLTKLQKENFSLSSASSNHKKKLQQALERNQLLKKKLRTTEASVGTFIREMANLLEKHEPGTLKSESPKPQPKKRTKRIKVKTPGMSPDKQDFRKQRNSKQLHFD